MRSEDYPVDAVIAWVDGADPAWRKERDVYLQAAHPGRQTDSSESRYRDWGTIKYVLRGIEQYMPWIRRVFFVTWGHLPEWLNPEAEKLRIVTHQEYIPQEYLPTFSANPIELNLHRIPDLAEHFIFFNDDMLPARMTGKKDFFRKGLPADFAVETTLVGRHYGSIAGILLSDSEIINQNFRKREVIRKNPGKWLNYRYGADLFKTLLHLPWREFSDFSNNHTINPYLKSVYEEVWNREYAVLDETSRRRFRTSRDVNQWLIRDWQLVSGKFFPKSTHTAKVINLTNDLQNIRTAFRQKKYQVVCVNDVNYVKIDDFEETRRKLQQILEEAYPVKSGFEK